MKYTLKFLLILLIFSSCSKSKENLFWISENNGQNNDFLFMAESTNVKTITDSLSHYLTIKEIVQAEKVTYKNFGEIYKNTEFKVNIILRIGSKSGRDYKFIVRTFKNNGGIIDSYELAEWNEQDSKYCFGSINKGLIINRNCGKTKDVKQISTDGRIIATSYHGRE